MPALNAVTTPVELIVAMLPALMLHTPPLTASARFIVVPVHAVDAPVMLPAFGPAFIVTTLVAAAAPQLLLTA